MPPHRLLLKVGAPVMLIRNLDMSRDLVNGTRLIVTRLLSHTVVAKVMPLNGPPNGTEVLIPRINFKYDATDTGMPVGFTRRQFPLRVAFTITIDKSQGQTLERVGLYLPEPCFAHGQLYVGLSRVGDPDCVFLLNPKNQTSTRNVVYNELLTQHRREEPRMSDQERGGE